VTISGLRLRSGEQSWETAGRIEAESLRKLRIHLTDVDLGEAARLAGLTAELGGRVTGRLLLDGPLNLPRFTGSAVWDVPRWGAAQADRLDLEVTTERGVLQASAHVEAAGHEVLSAQAVVPHDPDALDLERLLLRTETRLEATARDLDLAWLAPFLPRAARNAHGRARLEASIRGGAPVPEVRGEVEVTEGSIEIPILGQTLSPLTAKLQLDPEAIRVERIRAGEENTDATLSGTVGLSAGRPTSTDLTAQFRKFKLGESRRLSAIVDGEIALRGPIEGLEARGDLELSRARLTLPEPEDRLMREIRVLGLPGEDGGPIVERARARPGVWERTALDLGLAIPRNTWLEGRGLILEVAGDLRVTKDPLSPPHYTGSLETVRGTYRLQGKSFEIRSGVVTLTGATALDPDLQVVAAHRVRDVTILAELSGPASEPQITLSSEPPLSETDMLSYLVFGRPSSELADEQSSDLGATATSLAGTVAAGELSRILGVVLPVDTLEMGMSESGSSPELGVGKYIHEDVYIRYGQDLGVEGGADVEVEWRLTPNWSVESEIEQTGESGVDVIWNRDY
jgi:translocation and assembly module TamB